MKYAFDEEFYNIIHQNFDEKNFNNKKVKLFLCYLGLHVRPNHRTTPSVRKVKTGGGGERKIAVNRVSMALITFDHQYPY